MNSKINIFLSIFQHGERVILKTKICLSKNSLLHPLLPSFNTELSISSNLPSWHIWTSIFLQNKFPWTLKLEWSSLIPQTNRKGIFCFIVTLKSQSIMLPKSRMSLRIYKVSSLWNIFLVWYALWRGVICLLQIIILKN